MAKQKTQYVCQECGYSTPRWAGRCDSCGAWNTFVEERTAGSSAKRARREPTAAIQPITAIDSTKEFRLLTGMAELDRVLGGGIVPGSVTLLGGDPGIGKSTLMMQLCRSIASSEEMPGTVLYISGEESARQLKMRAERLNALSDNFLVTAETSVEQVTANAEDLKPALVVVDSIQTMQREDLDSTPGSVAQLRESTAALLQMAKTSNTPVIIIGHVTKEGFIAGPRVLEHMVDTVLQFEGDSHHTYRIVRCVKNRFGSTNEIGIFEMTATGMREVSNPSEVFLSGRSHDIAGSCVCPIIEGTRALLIEVQSLVTESNYGTPQRTVTGIDGRRHSLLLAVLEKRYGLRLGQFDVFTNIAGGVKVDETAADLAIAMAVISSTKDIPIDFRTAIIGELGLGGEVRSVSNIEKRISEAEKLGFTRILIPAGNIKETRKRGIQIKECDTLSSAMDGIFPF
ncbi:MAG: DNA repair protein RadA [Ectothiorhodospiraceae bacterium]|nr:DNA repair protein RadA [Ectothiorhodospiraceae bacterium]